MSKQVTIKDGCLKECDAGGHTLARMDGEDIWPGASCPNACGEQVECGGHCCQDKGHDGPCMCAGDWDDQPGSCPA